MTDPLLDRVDRLCGTAALLVGDHALSAKVAELRIRLREPLRVAVAGRVKAGKSTLLNALVGERLAPTDAGECTRIITWYKKAAGYEVTAVLRDGSERALRFHRTDSSLATALDGLEPSDLERIVVGWPSSRLDDLTLIDTPGLEGHDDHSAMRTLRFLGLEDEGISDVDAVIYLMRHMHRSDAGFLEAFMDRSLSQPSSVNAVAVLSRADEIGAGRLDALISARAIARRYREDERVRALCSTVIPVAGLIAETGATLREDEAASLRSLAAMPADALAGLLLSVDRFCDPASSPLPSQTRQDLIDRFGLFGVRFALNGIIQGDAETASALSRALIGASGIGHLA
ncbi:MAG: dynamin family protein, partial [Acidimicrobiia bacterium]